MKRLVLFTAIILSFASSFAQKISFTDTTNVWSVIDSTIGCCIPIAVRYTTASYDSSTFTYNGNTYRYLVTSVGLMPVRESAGKVYALIASDSVERLMYDFNLGVNDTIRTNYPEEKFIAWVTNIDSTQIAGQWYKVWHFEGTDSVTYFPDSVHTLSYNVIEGIGCTNGPLYPASPYTLSAFSQQLLCFKSDLTTTSASLSKPVVAYGFDYISHFDNDSSCAAFYSDHGHIIIAEEGINQVSNHSNTVKVVPNPADKSSKLVLPYPISSGTVSIVTITGQVIANISFQATDEIVLGDKLNVPGLYFYRVTDITTGKFFSGKFVY